MAKGTGRPALPLMTALDRVGYARWYAATCRGDASGDPWRGFVSVREAVEGAPRRLRPVLDVFVSHRPVNDRVLHGVLGHAALTWLENGHVTRRVGQGRIEADFCLLSCMGAYLFLQWPTRTHGGLIAADTYLSRSSLQCAATIVKRMKIGRALDIGSGSGLLTVLLARRSAAVTAVDIDLTAVKLTRLNLAINGCRATIVQSDLVGALPQDVRFDFVIANPPWRIVPPGIRYPNPLARVGRGPDGLESVIRILQLLPRILTKGGEAVIRFDIPMSEVGCQAFDEVQAQLRNAGCDTEVLPLGFVTIEQQAAISAETCRHLNLDVPSLERRFLDHYASLGISVLWSVQCVIRNYASDAEGGRGRGGHAIWHQRSNDVRR